MTEIQVLSNDDLRDLANGLYRVVRGNATVRVLHRAYNAKGADSHFVVLLRYPCTLRRIDDDPEDLNT